MDPLKRSTIITKNLFKSSLSYDYHYFDNRLLVSIILIYYRLLVHLLT